MFYNRNVESRSLIYFFSFKQQKGGHDYEAAVAWLKKRFASLNRNQDKPVYIHATEATNTENVRFVFTAVEEIILYESLASNYLL